MARLNDPVVPPDGIETLRRKFLRQNRDIARINSSQSLRIRGLENECARLLSENLDLRGQILRLEHELQESKAQKIADHALDIKAKMEAQLIEWGALLAGLGNEPMQQHRSPRARKMARTSRNSLSRMSGQWRQRRTSRDLDAATAQEGRLPPLWENKPCPRETLNREDILALCSEAEEQTDSPDLGPPPVSRFVDEDPVKIDLPTKNGTEPSKATAETEPDVLSTGKAGTVSDSMPEETGPTEVKEEKAALSQSTSMTALQASQPNHSATKTGFKRKSREEEDKENAAVTSATAGRTKPAKDQTDRSSSARVPLNRPIKELPSGRRHVRENGSLSNNITTVGYRKPLTSKSANGVVNSPKKTAKSAAFDDVAKAKELLKDQSSKDRLKPKKRENNPIEITVPLVQPAAIAVLEPVSTPDTEQMPATPSADPHLSAPDSPGPESQVVAGRDTPPPVDISAKGETTRGSRRARTAVSYAEPNLRDKMRRPTKQLLDAVSGEGKYVRRPSHSKIEEHQSGSTSAVKSEQESETSGSWKNLPINIDTKEATSPLSQKVSRSSDSEDLPSSVVTDRKRRVSSASVRNAGERCESLPPSKAGGARSTIRRLDEVAAREAEVAKILTTDGKDVYEFTSSSPSSEKNVDVRGNTEEQQSRKPRHIRSRRLSSMENGSTSNSSTASFITEGSDCARLPRKRASMAVVSRSRLEDDTSSNGRGSPSEGSSGLQEGSSPEEGSIKDRAAMRRRSMML